MQFHEEFSTILDVKQNQNDLILRLDISDWFTTENYKGIVLELKLIECKDAQVTFEEIKRNVGELIWTYEFKAEKKLFHIWLDNSDEIEITCAEILENRSDLTIDELFIKFQWLAESYQRESKSSSKGWGKYQQLNNLLKTELNREIQNWEEKKSFFERNESVKADKAETVIRLCKRVLNYINQIEKENNA